MRKRWVLLLFPVLLLLMAFDGKRPSKNQFSWTNAPVLKGKVKSYHSRSYDLPIDTAIKKRRIYHLDSILDGLQFNYDRKATFDLQENAIEEITVSSDMYPTITTIHLYNKNNVEIEEKVFNNNNKLLSNTFYTYDLNNNVIEYKTYDSTNRLSRNFEAKYNKQDSLVEELYFNYDKNHYNIGKFSYGRNSATAKYYYSNGHMYSKSYKEIEGNRVTLETYFYDYKNNLLNKSVTVTDDKNFRKEYISYDKKDGGKTITESKYDKYGHVIELTVYKSKDNTTTKKTMVYEYDNNGNYTKSTTYNEAGKIIAITIREIQYYQ